MSTSISRTALSMALFRAIESVKDRQIRLFVDPYAVLYLPFTLQLVVFCARNQMINGLVERSIDWRYPGARSSGVARTRLIDDWLVSEIDRGVEQLVILGAGFDSRCLRLSQLACIPVFELDRRSVLQAKAFALSRSNIDLPTNLQAVAIDFLRDDLAPKLLACGFRRDLRTVVLWEGVTNYLQFDAVRGVFDTFAQLAAVGSSIIFTYIHKGVLNSRFEAVGLERLLLRLARWGEPWTFGFYPEELPDTVSEWGYELQNDAGATDYRRLYLGERADKLTGYEFYRVARVDLVAVANNMGARDCASSKF